MDPDFVMPFGYGYFPQPGQFAWARANADAMHDAHLIEYAKVRQQFGRDLVFFKADGNIIASISPWEESPPCREFAVAWPEWAPQIRKPGAFDNCIEWLENHLGLATQ
jgi:hypothetical protein